MTRKSENRVREIFVSGLFKNNDTFKRKYDMRQGSPRCNETIKQGNRLVQVCSDTGVMIHPTGTRIMGKQIYKDTVYVKIQNSRDIRIQYM